MLASPENDYKCQLHKIMWEADCRFSGYRKHDFRSKKGSGKRLGSA